MLFKYLLSLFPFGYTIVRYYFNLPSLFKYLFTEFLLLFFIGFEWLNFFLFYSVYEIGYLDNDFKSQRRNEEVKKRDTEQLRVYSKSLLSIKFLIHCVFVFLFLFRFTQEWWSLLYLSVIIFFLFNRVSNKFWRGTFFVFLAFSKFFLINAQNIYIDRVILVFLLVLPYVFLKVYKYFVEKKINVTSYFWGLLLIPLFFGYFSYWDVTLLLSIIPLLNMLIIDHAKKLLL